MKPSRRRLLKTLVVLPFLGGVSFSRREIFARENDVGETVRKIVGPNVGDEKPIRGCTVGIVRKDEVRLFPFGKVEYGTKDGTVRAEPDGDTVFEIASVTKMFTGLLLAEMVVRKEVELDTPLADILPEGVVLPEKYPKKITLKQVVTHRSGLPRLSPNFWKIADRTPGNPYSLFTREKVYEGLAEWEPEVEQGARYEYSNYEYSNFAFAVLGNALADHVGTTYDKLLEERILKPLGMNSTKTELTKEMKSRFALGHDAEGKRCGHWELTGYAPGGGLLSTGNDMNRFAAAALGIYDSSANAREFDEQRERLKSAFALAMKPLAESQDGRVIGFGWHHAPGRNFWWHNGQTGGYFSMTLIDPVDKIAVVILTDRHNALPDSLAVQIHQALAENK